MRLCDCRGGPLRDTAHPNQLGCLRCGWWTPHGALPSHERVTLLTREAASILAKLAEDYAWAHSVSFAPQKPGGGMRRPRPPAHDGEDETGETIDYADPTGNVTANARRVRVRDYTAVAARLLDRIMRDLRNADEAIGEALFCAEPPGPTDHTKAPWHDTSGLRYPDPAVHAAQARRHARGEGIPT